jgi:hypothetical protein
MAVDGRAKNKNKMQSQLSGTLKNSQHHNEEMVSMMSVDEMPNPKSYTPPSKGTCKQRKRAGIMNYGNKRKATEKEKMRTKQESLGQTKIVFIGRKAHNSKIITSCSRSTVVVTRCYRVNSIINFGNPHASSALFVYSDIKDY